MESAVQKYHISIANVLELGLQELMNPSVLSYRTSVQQSGIWDIYE